MINENTKISARLLYEAQDPSFCRQIFRFRKALFVDQMNWKLQETSGMERDQHDHENTIHCAMLAGSHIAGYFRVIRCDKFPFTRNIFPELASLRPYPQHLDFWDISRFGCLAYYNYLSPLLHGLMFHFAISRNAKALVSMVSPARERQLKTIGLRMTRYGHPKTIGISPKDGRPEFAIAGEIPLSEQNFSVIRTMMKLIHHMEINDETFIFRSARFSA